MGFPQMVTCKEAETLWVLYFFLTYSKARSELIILDRSGYPWSFYFGNTKEVRLCHS